jgi:hypothetical protein
LRALGFAVAAVPVSVLGHLAAGGPGPDAVSLVLAFTLVAVLYRVLLAGRERSWSALAVSLVAAEGLLHALFMAGAGSASSMTSAPTPQRGAMGAMGHLHPGSGGTAGPAMVAAHVLAAIVLAWFLRCGEQAAWSAARRTWWRGTCACRALAARLAQAGHLLGVVGLLARAGHSLTAQRTAEPTASPLLGGRGRLVGSGRSWRAPPRAGVSGRLLSAAS